MSTYKGNVGNLMQHWTLCELLAIAGKHTSGLNFIDAHAMAPLAQKRTGANPKFDSVCARIRNHPASLHEQTWQHLVPDKGYPNSAAFVERVWKGDFSLLLCETNPATVAELEPWLQRVNKLSRCKSVELFPCDWRERFTKGLPSSSEAGLADGALTLVSFDPYMYNRRRRFADGKNRDPGNLYLDDIELALDPINSLEGDILIQLSTYSTNDNNPQGAVIASVNSILAARGFTLCGVVRADNTMMSLVYTRNVPWLWELANLPDRFEKWSTTIPG